jgi:hypothetical protein
MVRIRFIQAGKSATAAGGDIQIDDPEIRIGRSADCNLQLMHAGVAFNHALMRRDGDGLVVQAAPGAALGPADRPVEVVRLAHRGDSTQIGLFRLIVTELDEAGDFTISIEQIGEVAEDEARLAQRHLDEFESVLPNVRLWAFTLSCAILLLFFILPVMLMPRAASVQATAKAGQTGAAPSVGLASAGLAALWNVGTISRGHAAFASNCAYCHDQAFVPVRSNACLSCHQGIGRHADPRIAPAADIAKQRCETCHHEHKGAAMATRDRQADCVACHGNIARVAPDTKLKNALDFGTDHPQFRVALVQDAALHLSKRFEIGDFGAEDHSNVRFTHATHLKLEKLKSSVAAQGCAFCHESAPGGVTFKPVQFDRACSSCHSLQFEPKHPEWRLPHGHPEEVASRITGYYARAALAGETFPIPSTEPFFKPGAPPPMQAPTGADMVPYKTAQIMMSSIARSLCGYCHVTMPPAAGQPDSAWTVAPVFVPDLYMPNSIFSHARHATTSCQACHAARSSNGGAISLLPGIATCRTCHAGEAGGTGRVASSCASCHRFHDDTHPLLNAGPMAPAAHDRLPQGAQAMELRP